MKQIRTALSQWANMSDKDWEAFSSKLVFKHLPKKAPLIRPGETEKYLSFIQSGMVRMFIPKEDYDFTFGFGFTNSFMSAYDSFITQTPSQYGIETLTETELWQISYPDLQSIYENTLIGNLIGRKASEQLFLIKSKRELSLLNETAEERYLKLFAERPEVVRQIPLKYIASYIGITPQALSRIRKRIT